jgi:quercetin dioxygenase-like cupin family protein
MSKSLVGIELDNGGVLIRFVETAHETAGALHAQEARYAPRSRPPPYHCHPLQDERFAIVEGSLKFRIDGKDRIVQAGDEVAIARGTYHFALNETDAPAVVLWETRPALRTAEFFVAMNRALKIRRAKLPLAEAAAILHEYRNEFRPAKPPLPVQQLAFTCLAPFGRRTLRAAGLDVRHPRPSV